MSPFLIFFLIFEKSELLELELASVNIMETSSSVLKLNWLCKTWRYVLHSRNASCSCGTIQSKHILHLRYVHINIMAKLVVAVCLQYVTSYFQ